MKLAAERAEEATQANHNLVISQKEIDAQNRRAIESARELAALELFGTKNQVAIETFENSLSALTQELNLTEKEAKELKEGLLSIEQAKLDRNAGDLDKLSGTIIRLTNNTKAHKDAIVAEEQATKQSVSAFKSKIAQMFGLYNVYQMVRRAVRSAYQSIKELDSAMNEIAVVTDMTTDQLWGQKLTLTWLWHNNTVLPHKAFMKSVNSTINKGRSAAKLLY